MLGIVIISIYFFIGGVATAIINRKSPGPQARQRWIKYIVYFLIVAFMLFAIDKGYMQEISMVISLIGLYEIIKVAKKASAVVMITGLAVYLLLVAGFLVFSFGGTFDLHLRLYIVILTFDGFSQIAGQLFGKTKLAPEVSPGKTVEGVAGGLLVATITTILLWNWSILAEVFLAVNICGAALLGDLLASYYKRKCGVKDFSNLLPGHGGILDRFDSLIGATFLWTVLVKFFT